jgi:hypothetical protein
MLTVACVWIKSEIYNSSKWVTRLFDMVYSNLNQPFNFLVIGPDHPGPGSFEHTIAYSDHSHYSKDEKCECLRHCDSLPIIPPEGWPLWWYKLNLFAIYYFGSKNGDRVLYLDLDTVVMGNLDDLVNYPSDFVMAPTSGVPTKNHDFNSSVMVWTIGGEQHEIIKKAMPPDWKRYAGDQQWLSSLKMKIDAFPYRWIHKYVAGKGPYIPPDGTKVALMIQGGKNQALLDVGHTWIKEYWR